MRKHARGPAVLVLLIALVISGVVLRAGGNAGAGGRTLPDLERLIAQTPSAQVWLEYADTLRISGRFGHSAEAYRRALEAQPGLSDPRPAKFGLTLALAQGDKADPFFEYLQALILSDARLASEVLARRECQRHAGDPRFAPLVREAAAQAVD